MPYIGEWNPQSNLVGLWHLNGNSTDSSGNSNNGTDTNITYSLANGKIGQGGGLNGTNSKIVLPNSAVFKITGSITVMAWFKRNGTPSAGAHSIFQSYAGAGSKNAGFRFQVDPVTGNVQFFGGNNTGNTINVNWGGVTSGGVSTVDGNWHLLAGVYTLNTSWKTFSDGLLQATATTYTAACAYQSTSYVVVGCFNSTGTEQGFLNGNLDEIAVFDRALSDAEIRKWYAWSKGRYV